MGDEVRVDLAVGVDEESLFVVVKDRRIDVHGTRIHKAEVVVFEPHVLPGVVRTVGLVVVKGVVGILEVNGIEVDGSALRAFDEDACPCVLVGVVWDRAFEDNRLRFGT